MEDASSDAGAHIHSSSVPRQHTWPNTDFGCGSSAQCQTVKHHVHRSENKGRVSVPFFALILLIFAYIPVSARVIVREPSRT